MTIIANTFTSFDAKGIRESLANVIANIAPDETPFRVTSAQKTCPTHSLNGRQTACHP